MTECEEYGMIAGCNVYCPVYQREECHNEDVRDKLYIEQKQVYVSTLEESEIVQKRAFELGWTWDKYKTDIYSLYNTYIIFWEEMKLGSWKGGIANIDTIDISFFTKNIYKKSDIVENSIKQLKDKLNKIWEK